MSYTAFDASLQDATPVRLYEFHRETTTWRYAALPTAFVALGQTWLPESISSGKIESTGEIPKDAITVTLPITNAMAAAFLAYAPDGVTTLTVFATNYDDSTKGLAIWKGRVLSSSAAVATVTLNCEPIFSSLRRLSLRQTYQRSCRHMLFAVGSCNVDPAGYASNHLVTALLGANVTVSSTGTLAETYIGGTLLASDGTRRMIVGKSGNVLTIMRPIVTLAQDFAAHPTSCYVTLYPGCDKSTGTCRSRFNNLGCFGGFPGITGINPMSGTSSVF